jgi:hypothetical protein
MALKLLRTIRLDASDTFVFETAAKAGEWAVPGAFVFWNRDATKLSGRDKQAFRAGFLGLETFGHATLAVVSEASADERAGAVDALAQHLVDTYGAPDIAAARAAAEEEVAFAQSLADQPVGMLIAMHRTMREDGSISEQFRTLQPADAKRSAQMPCSSGAFAIVEDDQASPETEGDEVDLMGLVCDAARSPTP